MDTMSRSLWDVEALLDWLDAARITCETLSDDPRLQVEIGILEATTDEIHAKMTRAMLSNPSLKSIKYIQSPTVRLPDSLMDFFLRANQAVVDGPFVAKFEVVPRPDMAALRKKYKDAPIESFTPSDEMMRAAEAEEQAVFDEWVKDNGYDQLSFMTGKWSLFVPPQ